MYHISRSNITGSESWIKYDKICLDYELTKDTHRSPLWASYRASFLSSLEKSYHEISTVYWVEKWNAACVCLLLTHYTVCLRCCCGTCTVQCPCCKPWLRNPRCHTHRENNLQHKSSPVMGPGQMPLINLLLISNFNTSRKTTKSSILLTNHCTSDLSAQTNPIFRWLAMIWPKVWVPVQWPFHVRKGDIPH